MSRANNRELDALVAERWLPCVEGEEYYEVSDLGKVRSKTSHDGRAIRPGKVLMGSDNGVGHKKVAFHKCESARSHYVHRLVLEAFVGPCPEGMEACHNNGDSEDNRLVNLRWDTKVANEKDKERHGTKPVGLQVGGARFSAADIAEMRRLKDKGWSQTRIAATYYTTQGYVSQLLSGKRNNRASLEALK